MEFFSLYFIFVLGYLIHLLTTTEKTNKVVDFLLFPSWVVLLLICLIGDNSSKNIFRTCLNRINSYFYETDKGTLFLIRGVSGCGKTTTANLLSEYGKYPHFEADFYCMIDGEYVFDYKKLGENHLKCQEDVKKAMKEGALKIFVSNTSVKEYDVNIYKAFAEENGYRFVSLICENRNDTNNIHEVPEEVLAGMEEKLKNSIKLR